jgi:HNH endonuclease
VTRDELTPKDCWRAVVLYGRNSATYKIALATCLIDFAQQGKTYVSMSELAQSFFHVYRERLEHGAKQGTGGKTELERAVEMFRDGTLSEAQAIERVERRGFSDVIERFHTVTYDAVPHAFYVEDKQGAVRKGIHLTDNLLATFESTADPLFVSEVGSRWDLVEAAFQMRMPVEVLGTDEHMIYRARGHERVNITSTRPVLNAYQNGFCFYCGEALTETDIHVDHVIPRMFLCHDEIWNSVLTDSRCNLSKNARLPSTEYLERLYERNEYFIASNHPIRRHLVEQTGTTREKRQAFYDRTYADARKTVIQVWKGKTPVLPRSNPLAPLHITTDG